MSNTKDDWYVVLDVRNRIVYSSRARSKREAENCIKFVFPNTWQHLRVVMEIDEIKDEEIHLLKL